MPFVRSGDVQTPERPILVVEDDRDTSRAVVRLLHLRGYKTVVVRDGDDALAYLRGGGLACLILLDLSLPRMSGEQFYAEQMKDPKLASIPVVVFTATKGRLPDVAAHLRKGEDPNVVLGVIAEACLKD